MRPRMPGPMAGFWLVTFVAALLATRVCGPVPLLAWLLALVYTHSSRPANQIRRHQRRRPRKPTQKSCQRCIYQRRGGS